MTAQAWLSIRRVQRGPKSFGVVDFGPGPVADVIAAAALEAYPVNARARQWFAATLTQETGWLLSSGRFFRGVDHGWSTYRLTVEAAPPSVTDAAERPDADRTPGATTDGASGAAAERVERAVGAARGPYACTRQLLEEVDWLRSFGVAWPTVCQQLGRTPGALHRALYRYGRKDLAREVGRVFGWDAVRYQRQAVTA